MKSGRCGISGASRAQPHRKWTILSHHRSLFFRDDLLDKPLFSKRFDDSLDKPSFSKVDGLSTSKIETQISHPFSKMDGLWAYGPIDPWAYGPAHWPMRQGPGRRKGPMARVRCQQQQKGNKYINFRFFSNFSDPRFVRF